MASKARSWFGTLLRALKSWALITGLIVVALAFYAFVIEPRRIVVERASFQIRPWSGTGRDGAYRLVFISDFDLTRAPGRFERRVRDIVNDLEPDLVAVGGDLIGGDSDPPSSEFLEAIGRWLAGFRSRDGLVVVWGEQELQWPDLIRAHLPDNVRELHFGAEIRTAGTARIRFCGPDGIYPPLSIETAAGGRLLAGWGRSLLVAHYKAPEAREWAGVDVRARISLGEVGDGPGIAVLEGPGGAGFQLRVSPATLHWGVLRRRDSQWTGQPEDPGVLVQPGKQYFVRVRASPGPEATRLQSRIWPADQPEPRDWPVDLLDLGHDRPRKGTVAVIAGGAWTGGYRQAWESLEVRDLHGRVLLVEEFDDPAGFAARWENPGGQLGNFDTTVIIGHTPRFLLDMPPGRSGLLDVVLAGHSHGGQVRLPFFGPLHLDPDFPRSWTSGWVLLDHGSVWLYTSRGLASTHIPIRLNNPPEVTEMQLFVRARPPR